MERAVTYSVVARKKPNDLEGSAKYYALAQADFAGYGDA